MAGGTRNGMTRRGFGGAAAAALSLHAAGAEAACAAPDTRGLSFAPLDLGAFWERVRAANPDLDLGPIGDGAVRRVPACFQTPASTPWSEAVDSRDTQSWLAFHLASQVLAARPGGGTLFIPQGRYVTARGIALRSGVHLEGASRTGVTIENRAPDGSDDIRKVAFTGGFIHPDMVPGCHAFPNQIRPFALRRSTARAGRRVVALQPVSGGYPGWLTRGLVGQPVFVYDDEGVSCEASKGQLIPRRAQITYVTAASFDAAPATLTLEDALHADFDGTPKIARLGLPTTEPTRIHNPPYGMVRDTGARRFTARATGLIEASGIYDGTFAEFDLESTMNGLATNGLVRCTIADASLGFLRKGLEIKGYSYDTRIEDATFTYTGDGTLIDSETFFASIGQSSAQMHLADVAFVGSDLYPADDTPIIPEKVQLGGYGTVLERCSFTAFTSGILIDVKAEAQRNKVRLHDVVLVAARNERLGQHQVERFLQCAAEARVEIAGLACRGALEEGAIHGVVLDRGSGSYCGVVFADEDGQARYTLFAAPTYREEACAIGP